MDTIKRLYENVGSGTSKDILEAIMNNDCKYIIKYLESGNKLDYVDQRGESYLHKAARNDNFEVVDLLIRYGLDVNKKNNFHDTPLHLAVQFNNLSIVDRLIFKGANVNCKNKKMITPLHIASKNGQIEIINLLIANQAKISASDENGVKPIHYATQSGKEEIIRILLNNGASLNDFDNRKNTVLHFACRNGDDNLVQFILRYLSITDIRNIYGESALHIASQYCKKSTVELLVRLGYNPALKDNNHQTPLDIAIKHNVKDNADFLKNYLISNGYRDMYVKEEVYHAALNNDIQLLYQKVTKENVNEFNSFGRSLLYYSIISESLPAVEFLIEMGANIHVVDEFKHSALLIAMYTENVKIIEFLLKNKANVNEIFYNRSFLYRSVIRDNYEITKLLIDYDADLTYIDNRYRTVFSYALEYASDDIIELLVEKGANLL